MFTWNIELIPVYRMIDNNVVVYHILIVGHAVCSKCFSNNKRDLYCSSSTTRNRDFCDNSVPANPKIITMNKLIECGYRKLQWIYSLYIFLCNSNWQGQNHNQTNIACDSNWYNKVMIKDQFLIEEYIVMHLSKVTDLKKET